MTHLARYRQALKERLTPKRYHHSVCVWKRAATLADIHGVDWYKAGLAGLLHDICHCDTPQAQLKYLQAHGILLDSFSLEHPSLWHAICGRIYLKETLGIRDTGILNAVRYHTTGRAGMTALEQVVYLADATSEEREYPGVEALRALADISLDAAMFSSLHHTVQVLAAGGQPIVRDCVEAYNDYWRKTRLENEFNTLSINGAEDTI